MFKKKHKKDPSDESGWFGQLVKLVIMCGLMYAVYSMITNIPPEGKLVCDKSVRLRSLTQFGTCHKERFFYDIVSISVFSLLLSALMTLALALYAISASNVFTTSAVRSTFGAATSPCSFALGDEGSGAAI